ncbi:MAG: hypothetical protein ACRECM_10425, partial [Methyloceanibacter sp.]
MAEVPVKMALPAPRAELISLLLARCAALVVAIIGALILLAWQLPGTETLPGLASMTPAAAVGIITAAVGLFCFTFRAIRPLARLIGFALVVLGLAILSQDLFGFNLGIDQALIRDNAMAAGAAQSGEMRMATGVTGLLILFGLALLYAKHGGISSAFSQILALIILAQVLIVLAGYAYGVATYYYPFPFTDMSMYGAICGFLLALGLLAASPEYGIAAAIVEQSPAGEMLRRLLPGILVLPLVIGWFAHLAEERTYYDSAATLAIFAVASILVLALFAWTTIGAVRRADRDRNAALMELRGQREWLSTTLASIGDGVIATDPNGSVLLLNTTAEQMTG